MEYRDYKGYRVYEDGRIQRIKTGNFINPSINQKGYHFTKFKFDGKWSTHGWHRVVCFAWHGDPPDDGLYYEADHKDFNRTNNHKDNLQWLTKSKNNQKTWDAKNKDNKGTKNGRCTLTEDQVRQVCECLEKGFSYEEINYITGVSKTKLYSIKIRKNWAWLSKDYKW